MGVLIYSCEIGEKLTWVSDCLYKSKSNGIYHKDGENILIIENKSPNQALIEPFDDGVYFYKDGGIGFDMSYTSNEDFRNCLERMADTIEGKCGFSVTLNASGIDHCVGYIIAEEMLKEFEEYEDVARDFFVKFDEDDYGEFLYGCYKEYMKVLKECIKVKGVVRYH